MTNINKLNSDSCPFCEPAVGVSEFASSKHFRAIYNIAPILPGHSLVVPKRHVQSVFDLNDDEISEMMLFSRDVVAKLLGIFSTSAFNWTVQEGEAAGQTVPHLHLHLIPRNLSDLPTPGDWYPLLQQQETEIIDSQSRPKLATADLASIVQRLRRAFTK